MCGPASVGLTLEPKVQVPKPACAVVRDCTFYFEFGGGKTIVIVEIPSEERWDKFYAWAVGRRMEILTYVAEELKRKQAPSAKIEWQDTSFSLEEK